MGYCSLSIASPIPIILTIIMTVQWIGLVGGVEITYDHRGLLFDGQPKLLLSGSIHYPRSTPEMWPDLIAKAKDGGLDVIQTYVFWNAHEPQQGQYNFEDNLDLIRFLKLVNESGLYVNLRIGPFIEAEWNFGGLPVWLYLEDGVILRTNNTIFMDAMKNFTTKIVQMMEDESLFAWQGGPIILAQIENEFGAYDNTTSAYVYAMWAANMAVGLNTRVPWIMCKQPDAPDPVINTYNGGKNGESFQPNAPYKPKMWTEAYPGWFQTYGDSKPVLSAEVTAFQATRFFQTNGSFYNYYMYHGGTNFGRSAGGPFVITSYDYDAPLDEYGLLNQPKWGHLKELHQALKLCEPALMSGIAPSKTLPGPQQDIYTFLNGSENCVAFLSNLDGTSNATIEFMGQSYNLPAQSVSILPDCRNVAFNSAQVRVQKDLMQMEITNTTFLETSVHDEISTMISKTAWAWSYEEIGEWGNLNETDCCLDQLKFTKDTTDYLWYITSVEVSEEDDPILSISGITHAAHIFVNGKLRATVAGTNKNSTTSVYQPIHVQSGTNEIAILCMTVGLQSGIRVGHMQQVGIRGPITLSSSTSGIIDLSTKLWKHQVGLKGEYLRIYSEDSMDNVNWTTTSSLPQNQSMIWYKTQFDSPSGNSPLALDLITMGKGQAWINGQSIGRFWPAYRTSLTGCSSDCSQKFKRCYTGCGEPSQRWYHVPRSWLKETGNVLVILEEIGGDPSGVRLAARRVDSICASIREDYPPPLEVSSWPPSPAGAAAPPEARLACPGDGDTISRIAFASFGTPSGDCGSFRKGPCHARLSTKVVKQACLGKSSCALQVNSTIFGIDPCPGEKKTLSVQAQCTSVPSSTR